MPFSPKLPAPSSTRPWGLSKEHRISLNGLDFIPDLSGALFAPAFKALLIADLHLEKASNMARRGVHLPPYDTRASLAQLEAVIAQIRPEQLIFLGDSFHDDGARERIDVEDLARLRAHFGKCARQSGLPATMIRIRQPTLAGALPITWCWAG